MPPPPKLGDLVFSPPPAISLPQLTPLLPLSCWDEGFAAGENRAESSSDAQHRWLSPGSSAPVPRPHPRGGTRTTVMCHLATLRSRCPLGLWDTLGAGWLLLEVGGHPAAASARGRDALGGGGGDDMDTCASQEWDVGDEGQTWGL